MAKLKPETIKNEYYERNLGINTNGKQHPQPFFNVVKAWENNVHKPKL